MRNLVSSVAYNDRSDALHVACGSGRKRPAMRLVSDPRDVVMHGEDVLVTRLKSDAVLPRGLAQDKDQGARATPAGFLCAPQSPGCPHGISHGIQVSVRMSRKLHRAVCSQLVDTSRCRARSS